MEVTASTPRTVFADLATATEDESSGERKVIRRLLGIGRTGVVCLEDNPNGNGKWVVKVPQYPTDQVYVNHMLREIACYQKLNAAAHPYVLSCLGHNNDSASPALYLPYMENGDLDIYLLRHRKETTPALRMKWAFQLTSALVHLHDLKIFHTDLRPPNILLDAELNLRVADFEGASFDGYGGTAPITPQYSIRAYALRESLTAEELMQVDIYCLGSVIYVIQTGTEPFDSFMEDAEFVQAYEMGNFPDTSGLPLGDLILDIWRGNITDAKSILAQIVDDVHSPT